MTTKEDEEIKLRDQFAMAAIPALIQRYTDKNSAIWVTDGLTDEFDSSAERIAEMAYRIADKMRKYRLIAFK